jgi:ribosome recycling factor
VIDETMFEAEEKMDKAVAVLRDDLASVRTGRASPSMFAKIVVDYYGAMTPVNQLASFTVPEPRMAVISPYDKGSLGTIERAIRDSDLGVNPTNDGSIIRVVFPQLTEDRRRDLIKVARAKAEDSRVSIRNIRRHAKETLDRLVKDGETGEDDVARAEKELEKLTHRYVEAVDDALRHKEDELLEV